MILRPQLEPTDHQSVLDYYLANYSEVHIVTCNICGTDLAIEIRGDISGYKKNALGFTVLPFGDALLSSRVRLDGSMGYQCGAPVDNPDFPAAMAAAKATHKHQVASYDERYQEILKTLAEGEPEPAYEPPEFEGTHIAPKILCLNDTRGTSLEEKMSPQGTFLPHEVHAIQQKQIEIGWKPKVKIKGNKEIHETFTRERVK